MVAPAVEGIDLFKIAGRSISGWIPSLKTGAVVRQPFCSQLEEPLLMWLEYHPLGLCLVAAGRGDTIPLKETFDLPDPTWLQFRRRFDKLSPFCRIASHTSDEVRVILATLEQVYQPLFPQLNMRQWTSSIYGWLTNPVLDPTHSGRVTMDNLMKLVTTALEWSYLAGETEVRA